LSANRAIPARDPLLGIYAAGLADRDDFGDFPDPFDQADSPLARASCS
jgi:hypothetical protein